MTKKERVIKLIADLGWDYDKLSSSGLICCYILAWLIESYIGRK